MRGRGLIVHGPYVHAIEQSGGQVTEADRVSVAGEDCGFDGVGKLADVSRPCVSAQPGHCDRIEGANGPAVAGCKSLQEARHEQIDVIATLAQRGQAKGENHESMVEIAPERPIRNGQLEVHARCGENAHIDVDHTLATDAAEFTILDGRQQLCLQWKRQLADLVEEERAAIGLFEKAAVGLLCAGEGAANMAEELGLEEGVRHARTIDSDERATATRGFGVDRARKQPLAGPALARDQDRGLDARGPAGECANGIRCCALSENGVDRTQGEPLLSRRSMPATVGKVYIKPGVSMGRQAELSAAGERCGAAR